MLRILALTSKSGHADETSFVTGDGYSVAIKFRGQLSDSLASICPISPVFSSQID